MEPKIKSFGCFKILEKSDPVKDKPSENIINAKKSDFKFSGTQSKQLRVVIIDV